MTGSPAVRHALAVLDLLGRSAEPLPAATLARELGIPRSSVYRILATLGEADYVTHDRDQPRFMLGVAAYELAWGYQRQAPLRRVAAPLLPRLVRAVGHTAHFTILHGTDVVYLIEERAPGRASLVTNVGVRLPAEVTASGRAMLAHLSPAQISALYPSAAALVDRTGAGPRTVSELRRELSATRRRGYAREIGSVSPDRSSVAAAVVDRHAHPVAAVAVTFDRIEVPAQEVAATVEQVRRVTAAIVAHLGGDAVRRGDWPAAP